MERDWIPCHVRFILIIIPTKPPVADLKTLGEVKVEYETLPGWMTDISKCRSFSDLPLNAQRYVQRVEELLGVKIRWIGVGAARDAMIEC